MKDLETITLLINKEDKLRVLATCLTGILQRQQFSGEQVAKSLNQCLSGEKPLEDIPAHIKHFVQSFVVTTEELSAMDNYIKSVCDLSETEVLKDLSNLKKDSL